MRKWTAPELKVLTIEKTENGFFNSDVETFLVFNDSKKPVTPNEKPDELS